MGLHRSKITVATLCADDGPGFAFHHSWSHMMRYDEMRGRHWIEGGEMQVQSGPRVQETRCRIVEKFLRSPEFSKCDWLLMIDSDMGWEEDLIERLLETAYRGSGKDKPIMVLGALCFAGSTTRMFPTVYRQKPDVETFAPIPVCVIETGDDGVTTMAGVPYPRDQLVKVPATGTGCLLMHRQVLMHMGAPHPRGFGSNPLNINKANPYPWFREGEDAESHTFGEDITFCQRAQALGYGVYVDTSIKIDHWKMGSDVLNERTFDNRLKLAYGDRWTQHLEAPKRHAELVLP